MNDLDSTTVGTGALAHLLALTPQRVNQLAAAGILQKQGRGRFQVGPTVRAYVEFLRSQPTGGSADGPLNYAEERARLTKIQADLLELELAKTRGSMISIADAAGPLGEQCAIIRGKFLALASRVSARIAGCEVQTVHAAIYAESCAILGELTADADAALKAMDAEAEQPK